MFTVAEIRYIFKNAFCLFGFIVGDLSIKKIFVDSKH